VEEGKGTRQSEKRRICPNVQRIRRGQASRKGKKSEGNPAGAREVEAGRLGRTKGTRAGLNCSSSFRRCQRKCKSQFAEYLRDITKRGGKKGTWQQL